MSAWRREAIEKLPQLRGTIEHSANIGALWEELLDAFECAHHEPPDHTTIKAIYDFAYWCVSESQSDDVASATVVAFYEELPTNKGAREFIPLYMTSEQFLGMSNPFKYFLSPEEHAAFVNDYLKRREAVERRSGFISP